MINISTINYNRRETLFYIQIPSTAFMPFL
jgi:hypothetical protein